MGSKEIEKNVQQLLEHFNYSEFIYDLLLAYGISKTSVTRLKSGDFNMSKQPGEVLYKRKVFYKPMDGSDLLSHLEVLANEERILRHNPRFVILANQQALVAKDLKTKAALDIPMDQLAKHFDFFLPLTGSEVYITKNDNKADRDAAYRMAELYDQLMEANPGVYNTKEHVHPLNIFLSRLLFCFFAEDTDIFDDPGLFTNTLAQHTAANGSDG